MKPSHYFLSSDEWERLRRENRHQLYKCARKFVYPNFLEAIKAAAALDRKRKDREHPLTTYQCEFCGGFHVGNDRRATKLHRTLRKLESRIQNKQFMYKAPSEVWQETIRRAAEIRAEIMGKSL